MSRLPTAPELAVYQKAIESYLKDTLPKGERKRVEAELQYQIKRVSRPVSWAAPPSDMHRRIPQQGRAEIVKAHVLKNGGNLRDAVLYALAVEAWAQDHFDGMKRYRERFIHTQAGRWFTRRGTPSIKRELQSSRLDTDTILYTAQGPKHPRIEESRTWYDRAHISGPVRRVLGKEALQLGQHVGEVERIYAAH